LSESRTADSDNVPRGAHCVAAERRSPLPGAWDRVAADEAFAQRAARRALSESRTADSDNVPRGAHCVAAERRSPLPGAWNRVAADQDFAQRAARRALSESRTADSDNVPHGAQLRGRRAAIAAVGRTCSGVDSDNVATCRWERP